MNESRAEFWIALNIGDVLSQSSHLTPEQFGGYLWLVLHQWRRGRFREEEMGTICRFPWLDLESDFTSASSTSKQRLSRALAGIKQLLAQDEKGLWYSPYWERKKYEVVEKSKVASEKARKGGFAKAKKWRENHASSTNQAQMEHSLGHASSLLTLGTSTTVGDSLRSSPGAAEATLAAAVASEVRSGTLGSVPGSMVPKAKQSKPKETLRPVPSISGDAVSPRPNGHAADARFSSFRAEVLKYWFEQNPEGPELAWTAGDGKALNDLLQAEPKLDLAEFRRRLINRARSEVNASSRPQRWLRDLVEFAGGPLDRYKHPRVSRSI